MYNDVEAISTTSFALLSSYPKYSHERLRLQPAKLDNIFHFCLSVFVIIVFSTNTASLKNLLKVVKIKHRMENIGEVAALLFN